MQQPIRYYITKSGEEPTVRSVKIARASAPAQERPEVAVTNVAASSPEAQVEARRRDGVKGLVRGAIRKRMLGD